MITIYIDQNILVYLHENRLDFSDSEEFDWIYSTEHLEEIQRSNSQDLLYDLERIKARLIRIELDNNFRLLETAIIEPYRSPITAYEDFLSAKSEVPFNHGFVDLQAFFNGNLNRLNIPDHINSFKTGLFDLMKEPLKFLQNETLATTFIEEIERFSSEFKNTLTKAEKDIKPLNEMRKSICANQLSDIKEEDGPIPYFPRIANVVFTIFVNRF